MTLQIEIVPLLKDNYAYLVREPGAGATAIVDPSAAAPVLALLAARNLTLTHIINTHHHWDHTGGNLELKKATGATVVGPAYDRERIPGIDVEVREDAPFRLGSAAAEILHVPGHTTGQVSYWFREDAAVFTGDTLFSMGCGRLFEGTPAEMWASLQKLMALPDATRVYCGHEYTEANGTFALTLEPGNAALQARMTEVRALRAKGLPAIPSTIGLEKATNPFFRPDAPAIRDALGLPDADAAAVFGEIRARKDRF